MDIQKTMQNLEKNGIKPYFVENKPIGQPRFCANICQVCNGGLQLAVCLV